MKTKIIYISGSEAFDMADIRAAFEEVRNTLNLDKNTVLFGVPVDNDDAGLMKTDTAQSTNDEQIIQQDIVEPETIEETQPQTNIEIIDKIVEDDLISEPESVVDVEEPVKKRGRGRKAKVEPVIEPSESTDDVDDKVVPILSVLSSKENSDVIEEVDDDDAPVSDNGDIEIIEDIVQETENNPTLDDSEYDNEPEIQDSEQDSEEEPDLEKLLSAMKPLQEDILSDAMQSKISKKETEEDDEDNIDATLEQLATEFVQTQDKITSESKSSGRGRIGKLRNILPFKQSKHKDQGLGDLFGWAGVAANDEDFSVPGFFTNASSKK